MPKKRIVSPLVPEPPPQTWSNCLKIGNQIFVAGMTCREGAIIVGGDSMYGQSKAVFAKIERLLKAAGAATKALEGGSTEKEAKKAAGRVVQAEAKKAVLEDSTLVKFTKGEMKDIAIAAVKDAQEEIKQASKRAKQAEL